MAMISEEAIKDILRSRDQRLESIHARMLLLYEETDSDTLIKELASQSIQPGGMPTGHGNHRDLSDILQKVEYQKRERGEEIRCVMWQLAEEEEMINRVWVCFLALEEPYFSILQSLYVNNEKYDAVERKSGMSHKTFEKKRADGIRAIRRYYESGQSAAALMRTRFQQPAKPHGKKGKKEGKSHYEQLTLF